MSEQGDEEREVQYDEDGNPIPFEEEKEVIELKPETEDDLINHEELNSKLAIVDYTEKPKIEGKVILKLLKKGLSKVTADASKKYYGFQKLEVKGKKINTLMNFMAQFMLVRKIDFSNNLLKDVSTLIDLPHLESIDLKNNQINNLDILNNEKCPEKLRFLSKADFSKNPIKKLTKITLQRLLKLEVDECLIETCEEFKGHNS